MLRGEFKLARLRPTRRAGARGDTTLPASLVDETLTTSDCCLGRRGRSYGLGKDGWSESEAIWRQVTTALAGSTVTLGRLSAICYLGRRGRPRAAIQGYTPLGILSKANEPAAYSRPIQGLYRSSVRPKRRREPIWKKGGARARDRRGG